MAEEGCRVRRSPRCRTTAQRSRAAVGAPVLSPSHADLRPRAPRMEGDVGEQQLAWSRRAPKSATGRGNTAASWASWRAESQAAHAHLHEDGGGRVPPRKEHAGAPRMPTGRSVDGSRSGSIGGGFWVVFLDLREEGYLPPPPSAVGRPPPAAVGVDGRGEGWFWWRWCGRPGVASRATWRRLGFCSKAGYVV
jgi:hypothetical protein